MSITKISAGNDIPHDVNAIIEIAMGGGPVKYEMDKDSGVLQVDRFMSTSMRYPANYGYVPNTLSEDGDPADVLVVTPEPLISGALIRCRLVGMLRMTDESGVDAKLLAVPIAKLCKLYDDVTTYEDLPKQLVASIEHFFEHYKKLEPNKWVKLSGWDGPEAAQHELLDSIARYNNA